jgi:hypothetical protein
VRSVPEHALRGRLRAFQPRTLNPAWRETAQPRSEYHDIERFRALPAGGLNDRNGKLIFFGFILSHKGLDL